MKGFSVHNGDVIVNETIEMTDGKELLRQKAELVIGTNKGEWSYDVDEGIDFAIALRKNPDKNEIRATIEEALTRIDETFIVTEFDMTISGRSAKITFKAVNGNGEEIGGETAYAY